MKNEELQPGFARATGGWSSAGPKCGGTGAGFGVSKRSVERFWKRYTQAGTVTPKRRGGYRRSRLEGHDELLRECIAQQPDVSLEELRERLAGQLDLHIGLTALWHRLEKLGLSYKKNATRR